LHCGRNRRSLRRRYVGDGERDRRSDSESEADGLD
jgi:hypothetical protein